MKKTRPSQRKKPETDERLIIADELYKALQKMDKRLNQEHLNQKHADMIYISYVVLSVISGLVIKESSVEFLKRQFKFILEQQKKAT